MPFPDPAQPAPAARPAAQRIALVPVLSARSLGGGRAGSHLASLLDGPQRRMVSSGRIAIAMALRAMQVGPGDEVLVPAYHSRSMIPPVLWRGAIPVFYRLHANASVDLDDIARKIGPATRAVMVTHYFGFQLDLRPLRALCDARGLQLLEDCAHAMFGAREGQSIGASGDYAIGSIMKFLPIYEGGCLVSHRHSLATVRLHGGGAGFEAKSLLAALEASFAYGHLPWLRALLRLPLGLKDRMWSAVKRRAAARGAATAALAPASSDSSYEFDPRWIDVRLTRFSQLVTALTPRARIVGQRRAHYLRYAAALQGVVGARALYPALPDGVCPWLYPLLVDDADDVFARLVALDVPLVRFADTLWDGVDGHTCANSVHLSRHVLAFPCHQELDDAQVDWISAHIRATLRTGPRSDKPSSQAESGT